MARARLLAGTALLLALAPAALAAQDSDWAPPSRDMPTMPRTAELSGDWLSSRAAWFRGVDGVAGVQLSGLRAAGEGRGSHAQIARFSNGAVPVVVWTDRNGDTRADMIEIFRRGGIIIQLVDADFDGAANVIRVYDTEGKLVRQNPI